MHVCKIYLIIYISKYQKQQSYSQQPKRIIQLLINFHMGNIEIREQSSPKRRTHIFTQRKSYDPINISPTNSLTHRRKNHPSISPIRYALKSQQNRNLPFTERKLNVNFQDKINNQSNPKQFTTSPFYKQKDKLNNTNPANSNDLTFTKIKNLETQNSPPQPQQPISSFNLSGKIVSNSRCTNQQRKSKQFMNSTRNNQSTTQRQNILQNPYDNREIIKKVRNFNDFLNEIKRKLKQDKQQNLHRKKHTPQTFSKIEINHKIAQQQSSNKIYSKNLAQQPSMKEEKNFQKTKSTRKIQVALKLQNEKLQLQKYRKLVQRELSKTHSIENISLCTKGSGQKILTIQYQSFLNQNILSIQNSKSTIKHQAVEPSLIQKDHSIQSYFVEEGSFKIQNQRNLGNRKSSQKMKQRQMVNKLKNQYEKIRRSMVDLGRLIEKYESDLQYNEQEKTEQKILIRQQSIIDAFSQIPSQKNSSKPQNMQHQQKQGMQKRICKQTSMEMNPQIEKIDGLFLRLHSLQNEYQQTDRQIRQVIKKSNSESYDSSSHERFSSFAPTHNEQTQ